MQHLRAHKYAANASKAWIAVYAPGGPERHEVYFPLKRFEEGLSMVRRKWADSFGQNQRSATVLLIYLDDLK